MTGEDIRQFLLLRNVFNSVSFLRDNQCFALFRHPRREKVSHQASSAVILCCSSKRFWLNISKLFIKGLVRHWHTLEDEADRWGVHERDRKAHLWEQLGQTMNSAGEYCTCACKLVCLLCRASIKSRTKLKAHSCVYTECFSVHCNLYFQQRSNPNGAESNNLSVLRITNSYETFSKASPSLKQIYLGL